MTNETKLRYTFIFGAIVDSIIALSWAVIAMGYDMPSIVSGYLGTGDDYRFAMYVCAMFMFGWGAILAWGACNPRERRGLLVITAFFLLLSIIIELTVYIDVLSGAFLIFGVTKRSFLVVLFSYVYFSTNETA